MAQFKADASRERARMDRLDQQRTEAKSLPKRIELAVRQTALVETLRARLVNTRPPALRMLEASTETLVKQAEMSEHEELMAKAAQVRARVDAAWHEARLKELVGLDELLVADWTRVWLVAGELPDAQESRRWRGRARARFSWAETVYGRPWLQNALKKAGLSRAQESELTGPN
jgi:hypothetical protein